jgi:hypothetical protein
MAQDDGVALVLFSGGQDSTVCLGQSVFRSNGIGKSPTPFVSTHHLYPPSPRLGGMTLSGAARHPHWRQTVNHLVIST